MKTTVFDLIWKFKNALEKQGHEKIDLHRFTHERDYRKAILLNVDISELPLSRSLQKIYKDLLEADELELAKEVELPPDPKPAAIPVQEKKKSDKEPNDKPIFYGIAAVVLLVFGFAVFQFSNTTQEAKAPSAEVSEPKPTSTAAKLTEQPRPAAKTTTIQPAKAVEVVRTEIKNVETTPPAIQPEPVVAAPVVEVEVEEVVKTTPFRIQGSNTIGEVLAPELLKAFYASEGAQQSTLVASDIEVENNLEITYPGKKEISVIPIHAHGSSTGFKALNENKTDLAMASRRIKDKEVEQLESRYGNLKSKSTEHIIGMDGLAVIVNPDNPIAHLSTEDLAKLFAGNITNWSELDGPDLAVKIYARDSNSGTWDSFKSMVLKKHGVKLSESAERLESSVELSDNVSKTPGAIGFIGLPYVLRAKALAISDGEKGLPIYPTSFTISTEDYPLVRRLYIYEPSSISTQSEAHRFISFVLSKEGQDVVKKAGFISQNIYPTTPVLTDTYPQEYVQSVKNAQRLSLNFRFKSGTVVLDNKAVRDLERVIQFFESNPGQQATLIGFSDSIGDPVINRTLSLQRARAVEQALLARGINIQRSIGLGEMAPIASNLTKLGRDKNRRVEIWVDSNNAQSYNTATR
ncbi:phosphate ABC transporter substrate-binding/OmpA family protein [Neptuniibacter sp. SY11_33]|uniref:phosphate ABC transporter substrate-binding/OmpA family protein n=1 Tax=Neptuniibacter sp. SY11_33 TaxID=3398215 RepID=UPI0039F47412